MHESQALTLNSAKRMLTATFQATQLLREGTRTGKMQANEIECRTRFKLHDLNCMTYQPSIERISANNLNEC